MRAVSFDGADEGEACNRLNQNESPTVSKCTLHENSILVSCLQWICKVKIVTSFQELLDNAFPSDTDAALARSVAQGLLLAESVSSSEAFLCTPIGNDMAGHVRRAAVLHSVHQSCEAGDLPFSSAISKMPLGGGHWVELRSDNFRAHICRTDNPQAFPTDTPTRQDQRLSNQFELFEPSPIVIPIRQPAEMELYAWLTFGANAGDLTHLCWGMPKAGRNEWLARVNVIRRLGAAAIDVTNADTPSEAVKLQFRDHIERTLRRDDESTGANNDA